jgi:hypothetical protein
MTENNDQINTGTEVPTSPRPSSQLKHPWLVLALIALVALTTEQIFFKQSDGVQWEIFILMVLLAILGSVLIERLEVPIKSLRLFLPILLLTALNLFRSESFTMAALIFATLICLVWLGTSFLNGQWSQYRLREHINQTFLLSLNALIGLPTMLIDNLRRGTNDKSAATMEPGSNKTLWAVLRGLLIALPILVIFTALLASADAMFSNRVESLFAWLGKFNLNDFIQRVFLVSMIAYIMFGLFSFALTKTRQMQTTEPDRPMLKPFLGVTEASVVLGLVNTLFLLFLIIQFRYFFAGQVNVSEAGLTYSEYAVKGFQELIIVSCVALGLHWLLAGVTRRESPNQKTTFSVLTTLVIIQVGIILFSAFQRVSLYEAAYGFTQSRLVAHVFMVFVGLMLLAALWMQWRDAFKHQAIVLLSLAILFALTLSFMNVDRTIARLNLAKAQKDGKLDASFLVYQLSDDAVTELFARYDTQSLQPELQTKLGKVLTCKANIYQVSELQPRSWFAENFPRRTAARLYTEHAVALATYKLEMQTLPDKATQMGFTIDNVWIGCGINPLPTE